MKTKTLSAIFLILSCGVAFLYSADKQSKPLVAVMPFDYKADPKHAGIEKGLADALAAELVKTKKIRVIERERIDLLLKELALGQTGVIDSAGAARVGKQLGAQAYLLGTVVSVSIRDEWRSVKFAEKTTRWADIEAEAKIVDIETGEVIVSARAIGKAKTAEKHAFGGKTGELATQESVSQKAVQNLSQKLAKQLAP